MKNNSIRFSKTILALSVMLLAPRLILAGTDTWTGGGGANNLFWLSTLNWNPAGIPQSGDSLVFTNAIGLVNSNNIPSANFNGITFATPSGAFVLNGTNVTLANITDLQVVTPETINLPITDNGPANLNLNIVANGVLNLNNQISGTGALTNNGAGTLNLNGNNTFAGPLVVNAGTVAISAETNLSAPPVSPVVGNIVLNGSALKVLNSLALNANRGITVGSPTVSGVVGTIQTVTNNLTAFPVITYGGVIANNTGGASGLSKLGLGGLTLFGTNTYTGTTSNEVGLLTLDFSQASATSNIISSASSLVFGGANAGVGSTNYARLVMTNKAGTINAQTFNGTHVTIGAAAIEADGVAGGTANLTLGSLDHDAGGVLTLNPPTLRGGQGNIITTTTNFNGILGGWATIGNGLIVQGWSTPTNWACVDGSGNIINFSGFTNYTSGYLKNFMSSTNNLLIPSSITGNLTNDVYGTAYGVPNYNDVNTVAIDRSDAWTWYIGTNNILRLGKSGGIILRNPNTAGIQLIIGDGSGRITAGGPNIDSPGEIVFTESQTASSINWMINDPIMDNGNGAVTVIKTGTGFAGLAVPNAGGTNSSYSGGTYVLGGRFRMNTAASFAPGPLYIFPGGYVLLNLGATVTNAAFISGTGAGLEAGIGAFRFGTGLIYAGPITLIGDSEIGGFGAGAGGNVTGPISGSYNLILGNAAVINSDVTLSNPNNSWSGNTTITARINNAGVNRFFNGASDVIPNGFGKGNVFMQGFGSGTIGTVYWDLNGFNETINGLSSIGGADNHCIISNGIASTISTLTVGDNDQSGIFGGILKNGAGTLALTKIGGGVETLTNVNTYTGATTISNGVLQLSGTGTIANSANVNINGGTFDVSSYASYVVPSTQTININGGTFAIGTTASSSTTPVNFTNGTLKVTALNGSANLIVTTTLNIGGSVNVIQVINAPLINSYPSAFPVITYTTLSGIPAVKGIAPTFSASLPTTGFPPFGGFVSNDPASSTIYLVMTNGPVTPLLTWVGFNSGALNSSWDFVDNNWTNKPAHQQASYADGSLVVFDDGGRTNVVSLNTQDVYPAGITFNNTNVTYTLTGSFAIRTNSLTKNGTGKLILDNTGGDTYGGGMTINAGTVQLGINDTGGSLGGGTVANNGTLIFDRANSDLVITNSISGSVSGLISNSVATTLTLSGANAISGSIGIVTGSILQAGNNTALGATNVIPAGAALDLNGKNLGQEAVVTSGSGVNPLVGAIYNSAPGAAQPGLARLTLLGDTTFGAPLGGTIVTSNRWDLRSATITDANGASLSTGGHAYNLTKVGTNQVSITGVTVVPALGNIDIQQGVLSVESATTGLGNPASNLTVENGADLSIFQATNQFNKNIILNGSGINSGLGTVNNTSGNNTIAGTTTLNGDVVVTYRGLSGNPAASGSLTLSGAIGGAGVLQKEDTNTTLTVSSTADGHSGGTFVNAGTFLLNGTSTSTFNVLSNLPASTIGGNGTNKGPVLVQGTIFPGAGGKPGTFGAGGLFMDQNSLVPPQTAEFSLGSSFTVGGGVNDLINVSGDLDGEFAPITINETGPLQNGTYTLIKYSGSLLNGFHNPPSSVLPNTRYTFSISTATAGLVTLTVGGAGTQLEWNNDEVNNPSGFNGPNNGVAAPGQWDVATSRNWLNLSGSSDDIFDQLDTVLLDDSIITTGATNVITITTNLTVIPGVLLNNSTTNYVINGPGSIGGGASIVKQGTSTLTLNNSNSFTGTTTISGGTILINNTNALSGSNSPVIITSGGTLDIGGPSFAANLTPLLGFKPIFISGMGVGNNGAIVNNSANQQNAAFENLTLTGDAAIGGNTRWDIGRLAIGSGVLSTGGHPYNLYKTGPNYLAFLGMAIDTNLANIDIQNGLLAFQQAGDSMGNPASNIIVEAGATLDFYNGTTNLSTYTKQFVLNGDGVSASITNENGFTTLNGSMILNGNCVIGVGAGSSGGTITNNCVISGSGGLIKGNGSPLVLTTNETYTGDTVVKGGTLALVGTASIANTTNIFVSSGAIIDISGRTNGLLTLGGQALKGSGTIAGSLSNAVGSTVSPSTNALTVANLGASGQDGVAIMTVTSNVWLNGTTIIKIDAGNATNDVFASGATLTYGGTLTVTNISVTALTAGQSFKVFNATTFSATPFSTLNLPTLSTGLLWNTSSLAVNGTLSVTTSGAGTFTNKTGITSFSLNGGNIVITGTNGQSGDAYYLLESTNVALPLSQWITVATNVVGASGNFTFTGTNAVLPGDQQQFYILSNTNSNPH